MKVSIREYGKWSVILKERIEALWLDQEMPKRKALERFSLLSFDCRIGNAKETKKVVVAMVEKKHPRIKFKIMNANKITYG